jgi:hypothetical protein
MVHCLARNKATVYPVSIVTNTTCAFDALDDGPMEREMRRVLIAMAALLASASIFSLAAPATAQTYPVCLAGGSDEDGMRCDYTSFDQCRATASGIGGYCVINPASAASRRDAIVGRRTADAMASAPLAHSWTAGSETTTKPWSAPVGHRQPRATDLPTSMLATPQILDQEDADVDRKIRSVCRGC